MKKQLLLALILTAAMSCMAQKPYVRPHHGHGGHETTATHHHGYNHPYWHHSEAPYYIPPMSMGMNPQDYEYAYKMLAEESFDSSRLKLARQIVSTNPMSVNQIIGICKLFSFESNKLDFAKFAYRHCTDKNRYFMVNEVFNFESSKRELRDYIMGL
jgi:hypothetical protein